MAIGTTADFSVTRTDLIELAYSILGVTEISNDETALAVKILNAMVRNLDSRGTWLWAIDNTESTLTLVGAQQEYATGATSTTIATDILKLEWCAVLTPSDRKELVILDKKSSLRTALKDDTSAEPEAVHLERATLRANNKMLFYPTPNSAYSVVYHYRRPLFEFDAASDNPDVPQDWFSTLYKMLAYELSPHFGKPLTERQLLKAEAEESLKNVDAFQTDRPAYIPLKTEYF